MDVESSEILLMLDREIERIRETLQEWADDQEKEETAAKNSTSVASRGSGFLGEGYRPEKTRAIVLEMPKDETITGRPYPRERR